MHFHYVICKLIFIISIFNVITKAMTLQRYLMAYDPCYRLDYSYDSVDFYYY